MSHVYRLIYISRSVATDDGGHADQIATIVASSRRNNKRTAVTGALLVHGRAFVQVLEGARSAVEETFERILRDARHVGIGVLQREFVAERFFADWAMACVERLERGSTLLGKVSSGALQRFSATEGDTFCATLLAVMNGDGTGAVPSGPGRGLAKREVAPECGELHRPIRPGVPSEPSEIQTLVLRELLNEERERTTALRRELDDVRIALAQVRASAEATERHRDIWADRSRQLRAAMSKIRIELETTQAHRDDLKGRLDACEFERNRLRIHRDIWAERTRSLAKTLCREPALHGVEERSMVAADESRRCVVPN